MWGHVLGYLRGHLSRPTIDAADAALAVVEPFPALVKPTGGISDTTALKSVAHVLSPARLLLVALLADRRSAVFTPVVRGERICFL